MRYTADFRGMAKFLAGSDARRICTLAAASRLAKARVLVGHDDRPDRPGPLTQHPGDTARSGRLVHGVGGRRNDRVRVTIAFDGAAVPQQFGRGASRFLTRALEGD